MACGDDTCDCPRYSDNVATFEKVSRDFVAMHSSLRKQLVNNCRLLSWRHNVEVYCRENSLVGRVLGAPSQSRQDAPAVIKDPTETGDPREPAETRVFWYFLSFCATLWGSHSVPPELTMPRRQLGGNSLPHGETSTVVSIQHVTPDNRRLHWNTVLSTTAA